MGDKPSNCRQGMMALSDFGLAAVTAISPFYRTEPVDYQAQDWFVNAVFSVTTTVDPWSLFERLKAIEQETGRTADAVRFGPRVLDLDILLFNDLVINDDRLTIPHPRMHKRRFVLQPICDIAPHVVHPALNETMRQLLNSLPENEQKVVLMS